VTGTFTVPYLFNGSYVARVKADFTKQVAESDEPNNNKDSAPLLITKL